jgi:ParB family chromosome partitioning protein
LKAAPGATPSAAPSVEASATQNVRPSAAPSVEANARSVPAPRATPGAERLAALEVPIGQIAPDPEQPRSSFSEERMQALTASIRACGVIQPLLVRTHPGREGRLATPYMLIVGERRWTAARRAGLATVPIVVRDEPISASDRLMLQVAENDSELHEDLRLFDLVCAVGRAFDLARCSQVQFARRHRRSPAWVSLMLELARAEGVTREALREGLLQGVLAARTFFRLSRFQQGSLLAEARATGVAIGLQRAEKAAAQSEARRRQREAAGERATASQETAAGGGGRERAAANQEAASAGGQERAAASQETAAARGRGSRTQGHYDRPAAGPHVPPGASQAAKSPTPTAAPAVSPPAGAVPAAADALPLGAAAEPCGAALRSAGDAGDGTAGGTAGIRAAGAGLERARTPPPYVQPPSAPAASVAARRPRVDGPWVTLEITAQQLEKLVILLGQEPAGTTRELVEQLLAFL